MQNVLRRTSNISVDPLGRPVEGYVNIHHYRSDAVDSLRGSLGIPLTRRAAYVAREFDDAVMHLDTNSSAIDGWLSI